MTTSIVWRVIIRHRVALFMSFPPGNCPLSRCWLGVWTAPYIKSTGQRGGQRLPFGPIPMVLRPARTGPFGHDLRAVAAAASDQMEMPVTAPLDLLNNRLEVLTEQQCRELLASRDL